MVVCNEEHRFLVQNQIEELETLAPDLAGLLSKARLLLEPEGRNTAPALTLAALATKQGQPHEFVMVVTPADQTVVDDLNFQHAIQTAVKAAYQGAIVTLGVTPSRPETGYGYMQVEPLDPKLPQPSAEPVARRVLAFKEKPNKVLAESYLKDNAYFWNAGIFVLTPSTWLGALQRHRPDIHRLLGPAWEKRKEDVLGEAAGRLVGFIRPDKTAFCRVPSESIDYAVMEPSSGLDQSVLLVPLAQGWNDLGAWDAVWSAAAKDGDGNSFKGDVLSKDTKNNLVHASHRLVSLLGVEDLVVVETADAVLIANKDHSQKVKAIVEQLKAEQRGEGDMHRKVHRPWGWYDSIDEGERFRVKRIMVRPGASLSLQKHHHRAEHWVVVKGTAEITIGQRVILLTENQSTFIPLGEVHRLANPGNIPLEIIEVQSGSYLGEDDIVRLNDLYGRQEL